MSPSGTPSPSWARAESDSTSPSTSPSRVQSATVTPDRFYQGGASTRAIRIEEDLMDVALEAPARAVLSFSARQTRWAADSVRQRWIHRTELKKRGVRMVPG